ncbi:MAG: P1 family peptidase [Longimicrobiales bacterium]
MNRSLTGVPGLRVGHATAVDGTSGCTVVLGPFRAAVEVRGLATGSRELGVLAPEHLVPRVDALLLTGGSAFGLSAADGVMAWLAEAGQGYDTGVVPVPIVPAAVIFDLTDDSARPDPHMGRLACDEASNAPVAEGRVGAGTGATVGKLAGRERASEGGLGSWAVEAGGHRVAALAVVNALGEVRDADGGVVAGVRDPEGGFVPTEVLLRKAPEGGEMADLPAGSNTTLAVVATDAPLDRLGLARVARMASNALARRIHPVHTPFDGDVVFAVSTAPTSEAVSSARILALGAAAQDALETAITRAVVEGER